MTKLFLLPTLVVLTFTAGAFGQVPLGTGPIAIDGFRGNFLLGSGFGVPSYRARYPYGTYGTVFPLAFTPGSHRSHFVLSTPLVVTKKSSLETRESSDSTPRSATVTAANIKINVNCTGNLNKEIVAALAEAKSWREAAKAEEEEKPEEGKFRRRVNEAIVLKVGIDAAKPFAAKMPDLSDVMEKQLVVWDYPEMASFHILHEDSQKAVLILSPKMAGTFTVTAFLTQKKAFVKFRIYVDVATTPGAAPPPEKVEPPTQPKNVAQALAALKQAIAKDSAKAAGLTELKSKLTVIVQMANDAKSVLNAIMSSAKQAKLDELGVNNTADALVAITAVADFPEGLAALKKLVREEILTLFP